MIDLSAASTKRLRPGEPVTSARWSTDADGIAPALTSKVSQIAGYLPYSSVTFIIGLAVGFFK